MTALKHASDATVDGNADDTRHSGKKVAWACLKLFLSRIDTLAWPMKE
jgi:hypothetical protein